MAFIDPSMNPTRYNNYSDISWVTKEPVTIVKIESPDEFWIRLNRQTQDYKTLMCMMECYNSLPYSPVRWFLGMPTAVKSHVDGKWYRGNVTQTRSSTEFVVFLVDEGRREVSRPEDMRLMYKTHCQIPWLAINCQLSHGRRPHDAGAWVFYSDTQTEHFKRMTLGKQLFCTFAMRANREQKFSVQLELSVDPDRELSVHPNLGFPIKQEPRMPIKQEFTSYHNW